MTYTEAVKLLKKLEKAGYHRYRSGIIRQDVPVTWGGNTTGSVWGVNIDGKGTMNDPTGCPRQIWSLEDDRIEIYQ
jgi:hypothetical protein